MTQLPKTFQVNFPAVTVCPQPNFQFTRGNRPKARQWGVRVQNEKHTTGIIFLEIPEVGPEFVDEIKYGNISYAEFVDRIENGSIKPEDLGMKM